MKVSEELRGVGHVYRFTLVQHFKNRSNLISLIIMLLLAAVSVPLAAWLMGGAGASAEPLPEQDAGAVQGTLWEISEVYLLDESGYDIAAELAAAETVTVYPLTEAMSEEAIASLPDTALYAAVSWDAEASVYRIETRTGEQSTLTNSEIHNYALCIETALTHQRRVNLSEEERLWMALSGSFNVEVGDASELDEVQKEDVGAAASFAVEYVYAILLLMLCMMSSSYIIRAVAEEKSSKLIDLLMVSVRPLSLLCGKILAMMTVVFGTLLAFGATAGLSTAITGLFLDTSVIGGGLSGMGISLSLLNLGWGTVLVVLISLALSYLTYSIMSGIAGATCSTMADIDAAMLGVTFTVLASYIASCVVAAIPSRAVAVISALIPFVSAFCAPVQFVLGRIGVPVLLLSWAIQAALVAALAWLGAKVYRELILRQGKRVRLGEVLRMAKSRRGGTRHEA